MCWVWGRRTGKWWSNCDFTNRRSCWARGSDGPSPRRRHHRCCSAESVASWEHCIADTCHPGETSSVSSRYRGPHPLHVSSECPDFCRSWWSEPGRQRARANSVKHLRSRMLCFQVGLAIRREGWSKTSTSRKRWRLWVSRAIACAWLVGTWTSSWTGTYTCAS